jgi:hypothetical protein
MTRATLALFPIEKDSDLTINAVADRGHLLPSGSRQVTCVMPLGFERRVNLSAPKR